MFPRRTGFSTCYRVYSEDRGRERERERERERTTLHFQQAHVTRAFPTKVRDWTSVFSFILHLHFNMGFFLSQLPEQPPNGRFLPRPFVCFYFFIFLNFVPFFSDTRGFLRQRLHFNFNIWNSPPIFGGFNNKSDICVYGDIDVRTYIGIYICGRSMAAAAAVKHHLPRCRYAHVLRFQQQYITQPIYGGTSGTWQCGLMPIPIPIPNHSLHVLEAWPHSLLMPDPPDGFRK